MDQAPPTFEHHTSPFPGSNDGRLRVHAVDADGVDEYHVVNVKLDEIVLNTLDRTLADAFIAGYDEAMAA